MLTVDFDRLGLRPGDRVLDMGCGAGRHAFEVYRRGGDVVAFDQDAEELVGVGDLLAAMAAEGEAPATATATTRQGDALALPFADGEFDRVVAAEVLEHLPADVPAIDELARVLRPGGTMAVSVPRWLPELICWRLSWDYHDTPGGHVRIYTREELLAKLARAGLSPRRDRSRPRPARALLVAQVRGRRRPRGPPPHPRLPPAAGLGDHPPAAHPALGGTGARPPRRQEPGAVPAQAGGRRARRVSGPAAHLPWVPGVLGPDEVAATAASIAAAQEPDGALPWTPGEHTDVWNHVEAAMGLLVGGRLEAADAAYAWVPALQRADGSFPTRVERGVVTDPAGETNMSAYLAVGLWHHWLVRREPALVHALWPTVRRALDWVVSRQLGFGGIAWVQPWADGRPVPGDGEDVGALLAGSSSIHQALRAGVALADLVDEPQPEWEIAGGRLGHALRHHRDRFLDKATYSMDWYYPVLGGALSGEAGRAHLAGRWDDFVVPGLGARCVDTHPWVTGAETCELALALDAVGDHARARAQLAAVQHLRHTDGGYRTGWVIGDDAFWPDEQTTWTAGAVLLAVDAIGATHGTATGGSGIMRGEGLPRLRDVLPDCGCRSGDRVAGLSPRPA